MILFFIMAIISVFAAIMVVTRKNPVASAIYLIVVMCAIAGLFALLGAFFLAALQVIVYAGAIMVLFLFVIMLLNLRKDEFGREKRIIQKYLGFALATVVLLQAVFIIGWAMSDYSTGAISDAGIDLLLAEAERGEWEGYVPAETVAETLFTKFAYPFEVTSILLLAAIIGALVIARKKLPTENNGEEC